MTSALRLPLILSLVLNLLLIGGIAGHFLLRPPPPPPFEQRSLDAVEEVARRLPEEKAARLRAIMAGATDSIQAQKQAMKEAREKTTDILSAEPFDAGSYRQEVARLHDLRGQMMQHMADATMEAASILNPEERALLAATFRRYHGYWRKCAQPEGARP